ncbi:MAG TPA: DUF1501 domain-containing protein [Bacteroidetes bacterium]|nr:DUF1501 domain-containing protein [Bacteroidota bacterium]
MNRRKFIQNSALLSATAFMPRFLFGLNDQVLNTGFKRLIVIQLSGGNDGLNMIIPREQDIYYKSRPTLAISKGEQLVLNDQQALHPNLSGLKKLYENGELTIINNVGYPNPNRSHFRSMDIWQSGSGSEQNWSTGWLGRYLESSNMESYQGLEINDALSMALKGAYRSGIATSDPKKLKRQIDNRLIQSWIEAGISTHLNEHNQGYLYKTLIETGRSAEIINKNFTNNQSSVTYPNNAFAKQLKTTATLISSPIETRVYYVSMTGFDTHANQKSTQDRLMDQLDKGLSAFISDLKKSGTFDDSLIMVFSEFGRRVRENASKGTDHGAANNVLLIGRQLKKPGFWNAPADLSNLDANGDLIYQIDFRTIYASILNDWLGVDSRLVLKGAFDGLGIV